MSESTDPTARPTSPKTSPATAPVLPTDPSARVGKFVRLKLLGSGGMGEVWQAWDTQLARFVALKFLKGHDAGEIERFRREAQTAAGLSHPNIAAVYEVGEEAGQHYIAMQYVEGQTFKRVPGQDARRLVQFLLDAVHGVVYAHERGIVHRDIKPENIMVDAKGRVYVMDFGLARSVAGERSLSGSIVGTPAYMAPEQAIGGHVDPRADVYGLGATMYEMLTGKAPFSGATVFEILTQVAEGEPVAPRKINPKIDPDLQTIVMKCMEKDRTSRYENAGALAADLTRWLQGEPIEARPASVVYRLRKSIVRRKAVVGVAVLGIAGIAASVLILLPKLWRSQAVLELWGRTSNLIAEADLNRRAGELERSRQKLQEGVAACEAFLKGREHAHARYFLGRLMRGLERVDEAQQQLDRALELDPDLGEAHLERGLLLMERYRAAITASRVRRSGPLMVEIAAPIEVPVTELEAADPSLACLRQAAQRDLSVEFGRSSYFRDVDGLYGRAMLALLRDDVQEGETLLQRVVQVDAVYAAAFHELALLEARRSRYDRAIELATRAVTVDQGFADAYTNRGSWRGVIGDVRAEEDAERVIALQPNRADSWLFRMTCRMRKRDLDGALKDAEQALARDPQSANARLNIGGIRFARGDFAGAIEAYNEGLKLQPQAHYFLLNRAQARSELEDYEGALLDCDQAAAQRPNDGMVHVTRAGIHLDQGQYRAAEAECTLALQKQPGLYVAITTRCAARLQLRDFTGALEDCDAQIRAAPSRPEGYLERAKARAESDEIDEALRDITEAIRVSPNYTPAYIFRARLRRTGDLRGAEDDIETALKLEPRNSEAWTVRGTQLMMRGDPQGARAACTKAIELRPKDGEPFIIRGTAHRDLGDLARAEADYTESMRRNPDRAEAYSNRGILRERVRNFDGALADYGDAIRIDPRSPFGYANRGLLRLDRGDYKGALEDLTKCREVAPPDWSHRDQIEAAIQKAAAGP